MKLDYAYNEISELLTDKRTDSTSAITSVAFDSRRISNGSGVLFFALNGVFRDGHEFIEDAYRKGVRHFVVSKAGSTASFDDAHELVVPDAMVALHRLATYHRSQFNCKVVAITGSNGKTIVKEWLSLLLKHNFQVARTPKSYNSKLGVAISLFEIEPTTDIAIIEVGVPDEGEMSLMREMVQPTHGMFTSFGVCHRSFFKSKEDHLANKLSLFEGLDTYLYSSLIQEPQWENATPVSIDDFTFSDLLPFNDKIQLQNAALAIAMALELGMPEEAIKKHVHEFDSLALRLETFDGINANQIINDTYNLDEDSLRHSLEYQMANANNLPRVVLLGLTEKERSREARLREIAASFEPDHIEFIYNTEDYAPNFSNASVLVKGSRSSKMEKIARFFRQLNHETYLEFNMKAIRHNINFYKSLLKKETLFLCMVKASSYGADAITMAHFLENMGVDYLGVAYPNEGIELRQAGIKSPILVMNCEKQAFGDCIDYQLEPAIYSMANLDAFTHELIDRSLLNYPIHIKLETGMNRLGFDQSTVNSVIEFVKAQPEVRIQSVYSHLAEADVAKSEFTESQIHQFDLISKKVLAAFPHPILRHILNSAGIVNYSHGQFDMVRLGIGMYGSINVEGTQSAIGWYSAISQVKNVKAGDSVGYGRRFVAERDMQIAVIPVGYADGYRRSIGNGVGGVYIDGHYCPTVGNVCMDMIMVDVNDLNVTTGDKVEIIGPNQPIDTLAEKMETITYEVMTGFSKRVHRTYLY